MTSRWRDEFEYSKRVGTGFTDCYDVLQAQHGDYRFSIEPSQSEARTFVHNYTDEQLSDPKTMEAVKKAAKIE